MEKKKMLKVISPVEKNGGGVWWMRCGNAFINRDESINVYIDTIPLANLAKNDGLKFQIREYTEAELRERSEKKASYEARSPLDIHGLPTHGRSTYAGANGSAAGRAPGRPSGGDEPVGTDTIPF